MWIHEVDIHLAISAFAFGAACGLLIALVLTALVGRKK